MGSDLLLQIIKLIDISYDRGGSQISGDRMISDALKHALNEGSNITLYNQHLSAAWQLKDSSMQALSIDNVIDALEDKKVELVAKLGIVRAILAAEKSTSIFQKDENIHGKIDLSRFNNTWYSRFTKLLTENIKASQVNTIFHNIEIINFNYDRCFEYYLPFSIANYYGLDPSEVRNLMKTLTVHRPYGSAGRLPWQSGSQAKVQFGGGDYHQISEISGQIRTFTEQIEDTTSLAAIKATIARADRIIFLGFAFHRQNLNLISQKAKRNVQILATTFGISSSDKNVVQSELMKIFDLQSNIDSKNNNIELSNLKCSEFFDEYWRTLTASALESKSYSIFNI